MLSPVSPLLVFLCSIVMLRVVHILTCINSSFFILAEQYSVVWINLCVFIHSLIDGPLVYFQFLVITNKDVYRFLCENFHIESFHFSGINF